MQVTTKASYDRNSNFHNERFGYRLKKLSTNIIFIEMKPRLTKDNEVLQTLHLQLICPAIRFTVDMITKVFTEKILVDLVILKLRCAVKKRKIENRD